MRILLDTHVFLWHLTDVAAYPVPIAPDRPDDTECSGERPRPRGDPYNRRLPRSVSFRPDAASRAASTAPPG